MVTRNPLDLPNSGKIAGLDVGDKRVGIAVSDSGRRVALSHGACGRVFAEVKAKVQSLNVSALVVGYPLNMDGTEGPVAQGARDLAAQLEKDLNIPVLLRDERLSSRQAESAWFEQREGRNRQGNKKDSVGKMDAGAATVVLQAVLDSLK